MEVQLSRPPTNMKLFSIIFRAMQQGQYYLAVIEHCSISLLIVKILFIGQFEDVLASVVQELAIVETFSASIKGLLRKIVKFLGRFFLPRIVYRCSFSGSTC